MRTSDPAGRGRWAAFVTAAREAAGLSKAGLARLIGVDRGTVFRWESGSNRPDDPTFVVRVATALGVSARDALRAAGLDPIADPPPPPPPDPDVEIVRRRLLDPKVSEEEKHLIRAQLRYLADLANRAARERT